MIVNVGSMTSSSAATGEGPPISTGPPTHLLLADGVSFLLLADGASKLNLAGH